MLLRPPGQSRCQKQRMQGIMQNHAFGQEFAALGEREFGRQRNGQGQPAMDCKRKSRRGGGETTAALLETMRQPGEGGRLPQVSGHRRGTGPVPDFGENIADASYLGP